ncbi:MAG: HEAT repeat domain-containing protein [Planctomycetes bacterium]|nr:HEAT repeat domain-containing protein [Planctomycetota bacterium]
MATRFSSAKSLFVLILGTSVIGCADGPFGGVAALNPYYRSQWEKDESAGPTFHSQLAELRAIRNNPTGLSPEEQSRVIPRLRGIIQDSTNSVLRAEATMTLAEFGTPETIPTLQLVANDADADVRIAACKAWGRRGGPEAIEVLSRIVNGDSDLDVRLAATAELANFQDRQSLEALAVALNDKDPALQHRAVQSLKSVSGQDYGDNVPAWRDFVEGRSPALPEPPTIAERLRSMSWF